MSGTIIPVATLTRKPSCATDLPWIESPYRLISWYEMLKFDANTFHSLAVLIGQIKTEFGGKTGSMPNELTGPLTLIFPWIAKKCEKIGLVNSAAAALRLEGRLAKPISLDALGELISEFSAGIDAEMCKHTFLWVPTHRADFYSRKAEDLVGPVCVSRFKSIIKELEEGCKCYALERYTACAFHLSRATEAGVKALAKAIGFVPPHDQWDLVFKKMQSEFAIKPSLRPAHWQTHGPFLEMVWGDLRAVSKAWRNDIAHLVATYDEQEARDFLTVIPMFLKDFATEIDENGVFYPP